MDICRATTWGRVLSLAPRGIHIRGFGTVLVLILALALLGVAVLGVRTVRRSRARQRGQGGPPSWR